MPDPRETPAMQQYYRLKRAHPACVLLFRIGDFYEMFDDDAVKVSKAIGLTLTRRTEGMPMCGVPFHQLEVYLRKLIGAGFRVAVCEQLAEASQVKGLVPRGVTRVVTPGTAVDESLLGGDAVSTLAAVIFTESGETSSASVACVEVSTGEFTVSRCGAGELVDELARRGTREVLYVDRGDGVAPARVARVLEGLGISGTARPAWQFRLPEACEALRERFGVATFEGFGIADGDAVLQAAGAVVRYLKETQTISDEDAKVAGTRGGLRATLNHLRPPRMEGEQTACVIDAVSLRSLEVERTMRQGSGEGGTSLLGVFLGAGVIRTAMGKRLLRGWLCRPLCAAGEINARRACVGAFVDERVLAEHVVAELDVIQDIARIAGRVAMARCTPRDMVGLARSLEAAARLCAVLEGCKPLAGHSERLARACAGVKGLAERVVASCVDAPPAQLREGGVFKDGVDAELDECRGLMKDSTAWLGEYQARLISQYGLTSLRVGYNSVSGYYIELPTGQSKQAPAELVRRQTLKNAERYITPELAAYETRVVSAQSRGLERERQLFAGLCEAAGGLLLELAEVAGVVAEIDCLCGLAEKAVKRGWRAPEVVDEPVLDIVQGRHPVLDEMMDGAGGGRFVPNDLRLGGHGVGEVKEAHARLALITGPNMAGKSTFIRQTALIVLLAHIGSYVPAESAVIGVTDRIFTRIGADDALHAGQSTFMVEMVETANIINNATQRSLVVLDEVGRGTSTLDGLSLAWAIVEHLSAADGRGPRTLFATHYHELTELEERWGGRIKNLHVAVREWQGPGDERGGHPEIIFLHRIIPGRADKSYGLHVARLAGMPLSVVARGQEVLATLAVHSDGRAGRLGGGVGEAGGKTGGGAGADAEGVSGVVEKGRGKRARDGRGGGGDQMGLFREYVAHPAVAAIAEVKLETLTPMEAFDALRRLKAMVEHEM